MVTKALEYLDSLAREAAGDTSLQEVWIATRAALRSVLERVTLADLAGGRLPRPVARLVDDPDAWEPH